MILFKRALPLLAGALMGTLGAAHAATFDIADGDVAALKSALTTANTNGESDVINLASGGNYALSSVDNTLAGNNGLPAVENSGALTINGRGATIERVFSLEQTPVNFRFFYLRPGASLTANDLILRGGKVVGTASQLFQGAGGAIYNREGTLIMNRCHVTQCESGRSSGAILSYIGTTLTLTDCLFDYNIGARAAVFCDSLPSRAPGALSMSNCVFENNTATDSGGGLHLNIGTGTIFNSVFSNNRGGSSGAGLAITASTATVKNCRVSGNRAVGTDFSAGGGILASQSTLTVENCDISGNSVASDGAAGSTAFGGGIANFDSDIGDARAVLTLINSTVRGNTAGNGGGGVYNAGDKNLSVTNLLARNCTLSGNSSSGYGAGLLSNQGIVRLENSTITNNQAPVGAGLASAYGTTVKTTLANTIVAGNSGTDVDQIANTETPDATEVSLRSAGYNLVGNGNAAPVFTVPGDQSGVADPRLGALDNNGGANRTHALLQGSPAINAGDPAFDGMGQFDGRGAGFDRVKRGRLDIGAFESDLSANRAPTLNNATYSTSIGVAYSQQLNGQDADGDTLSYGLASGALPAGVTLSSDGLLAGTPTQSGRFDFSAVLSDGNGGSITAKFILIVSAGADGIGPLIVRDALPATTTRDALAALTLRGTIRDVAPGAVTPSGVRLMLFQIRRDSDGFSYSGPTDGFTGNTNRGYYPGTLSASSDGTTAGTRNFSRALSWLPQLAPGAYTFNVIGQDVAGNWSVEVVPITIFAAGAGAGADALPPHSAFSYGFS